LSEKKKESNLPLHQRHTVFSLTKTLERGSDGFKNIEFKKRIHEVPRASSSKRKVSIRIGTDNDDEYFN
jgi:hypothetical protein